MCHVKELNELWNGCYIMIFSVEIDKNVDSLRGGHLFFGTTNFDLRSINMGLFTD